MIRLLLCLLLAFPAFAGKPPKPQPDGIVWTAAGVVSGVASNYTPVVTSATGICVYSNSNGVTEGHLYRACGTWSSVGPWQLVFATTPGSQDAYIRTLGVARGASGTLYAVLYVGPCYGCTGGFSPAFGVSSDNGLTWEYRGRFSPFGINQSSAGAIVVDEARTDAYRFMVWLDIGPALYLVHSADGVTWSSDGLNQWPLANEQPQFCSAAKTQYGVHMICAVNPLTASVQLRHVFSCTGLPPWRVLEMASEVVSTTARKGTNLTVDGATLHALTSGKHWTLPIAAYAC